MRQTSHRNRFLTGHREAKRQAEQLKTGLESGAASGRSDHGKKQQLTIEILTKNRHYLFVIVMKKPRRSRRDTAALRYVEKLLKFQK